MKFQLLNTYKKLVYMELVVSNFNIIIIYGKLYKNNTEIFTK